MTLKIGDKNVTKVAIGDNVFSQEVIGHHVDVAIDGNAYGWEEISQIGVTNGVKYYTFTHNGDGNNFVVTGIEMLGLQKLNETQFLTTGDKHAFYNISGTLDDGSKFGAYVYAEDFKVVD